MNDSLSHATSPKEHNALVGHPATQLAALVRDGEVSAVEVVSAHLQQIDEWDHRVHAFAWVAAEAALKEAQAVDASILRGESPGPLAGVPFSVKDIISVRGMPLAAGSSAVKYAPTVDAPAVARLREAGGICIGKTNTPEFALFPLTWNETHGYTVNPLNLDNERSPGGSSGGEAAAIASGMSAIGLGSDFGGSVRWPAHCTGLASLRPSLGRVPGEGQLPGPESHGIRSLDPNTVQGQLQVIGPMARSVADLDLVMSSISTDAATNWRKQSVDVSTLRIGWCDGEGTVPVLGEIVDAVRTAATRLSVHAKRVHPRALASAADLFTELRATDQHHWIREWGTPSDFTEPVRDLLELTRPVATPKVELLWSRVHQLRNEMLLQMPDVLLLPVASIGAPLLTDREFTVNGRSLGPWEILSASRAITLFGLPSAVVPVGTLPDGSPVAVQVVTGPHKDELALAVADALERLHPADHFTSTPLLEVRQRGGLR